MAIQPTDLLTTLTNAKCAELRDELVALVGADATVRRIRRCAKAGADLLTDRALADQEAALVETSNAARQSEQAALSPIRAQRDALRKADYDSI